MGRDKKPLKVKYGVFRYSKGMFPKQFAKDLVMMKTVSQKEAVYYAIQLNKKYTTRYYWRELRGNE